MPALFTRISMPPRRRSHSASSIRTWSSLLTSQTSPSVWPFFESHSTARFRSRLSRPQIKTFAPFLSKASAMAKPIPFGPPVTTAILFFRFTGYIREVENRSRLRTQGLPQKGRGRIEIFSDDTKRDDQVLSLVEFKFVKPKSTLLARSNSLKGD